MDDAVIKAEGLSKRYSLRHRSGGGGLLRDRLAELLRKPFERSRRQREEEFWALKEVSFAISQGDVVGLIGRNGAGKSTLLKILSRITEPTTGRVTIRGRVASLLEVGTGFHGELSGRENIFLNGAILGMTRAEIRRKFDEIVQFAEVEKFLDTPVKHYSSGMYVRLAFAVAAHLEPEILIVDEVLAVGDAAFQQKCLGKMRQISTSEGRTVLFVSHNLFAVQQLCKTAIYLQNGRVMGYGPVFDQIKNYNEQSGVAGKSNSLDDRQRALDPLGGLRLSTIELKSPLENGSLQLPFGSALRIVVSFNVIRPIAGAEVGIGIFNSHAVEVVSTLSTWSEAFETWKTGTYVMEIDWGSLDLRPDRYRLGIGIKSDRGIEDYIPDALEIEVVPSETSIWPNITTVRGALAKRAEFKVRSPAAP